LRNLGIGGLKGLGDFYDPAFGAVVPQILSESLDLLSTLRGEFIHLVEVALSDIFTI